MGRKKFLDKVVRAELSSCLVEYLRQKPEKTPATMAAEVGVSRSAIYTYLRSQATPSPEILQRLLSLSGMSLTIGGRQIGAQQITNRQPKQVPIAKTIQGDLPFDLPVYIDKETGNLTLGIVRRLPGSEDRLEFTVELRIPKRAS
jgi:transcriptional regulator with XRE-family HTH domain